MLEIRSLDAFYGSSHILHGISFDVGKGEGVAVVGRNGAGKTTLLKSIMGGGPRVESSMSYMGHSLVGMPFHKRARLGLGLVPEDRRIFAHLTVAENVELAAHALPPGSAKIDALAVLRQFSMLQGLEGRMGTQLSGGQQQLLAVARTVAAMPSCLLLDEPTEGLAPVIVETLAADLLAVRERQGSSLLLTEQNVWFARKCTDRVLVLDSGEIRFSGSWAEFDADPAIEQRYLAV